MLLVSQKNAIAHALLASLNGGALMPPPSVSVDLDTDGAYDIARIVMNIRISEGEVTVGRKIGFSNRQMRPRYGRQQPVTSPMWAMMYDRTVHFASSNRLDFALGSLPQPRLEPELVFRLRATPAPDCTVFELIDCIEWMAHGFEIVISPYPDWSFELTDAIAAFGLHGALIVGEPHTLSAKSRLNIGEVLQHASVSLSRCAEGEATMVATGFGRYVMDSPVLALWDLHQRLRRQKGFPALQAGELITTGSWTDTHPVRPGERWISAFASVNIPGLCVDFVE
jgi:2-keto-4-pentenoate hydratase